MKRLSKMPNAIVCPKCNMWTRHTQLCLNCGHYLEPKHAEVEVRITLFREAIPDHSDDMN